MKLHDRIVTKVVEALEEHCKKQTAWNLKDISPAILV
jgi:hypothetical protein